MKISITKAELLSIMSDHFQEEVTEVTISKSCTLRLQVIAQMKKILNTHGELTQNYFTGSLKIPAIKALREVYHTIVKDSMGLAEAKWAIENWDTYINAVKTKGKFPELLSNGLGGYGIK